MDVVRDVVRGVLARMVLKRVMLAAGSAVTVTGTVVLVVVTVMGKAGRVLVLVLAVLSMSKSPPSMARGRALLGMGEAWVTQWRMSKTAAMSVLRPILASVEGVAGAGGGDQVVGARWLRREVLKCYWVKMVLSSGLWF